MQGGSRRIQYTTEIWQRDRCLKRLEAHSHKFLVGFYRFISHLSEHFKREVRLVESYHHLMQVVALTCRYIRDMSIRRDHFMIDLLNLGREVIDEGRSFR